VIENFKITLLTERAAGVENSAAALSVTAIILKKCTSLAKFQKIFIIGTGIRTETADVPM
jgi:aspartyl/asparaginyl-tRNA synthetase